MLQVRAGTIVVYSKEKVSVHPGPRAKNVRPARHGDLYWYEVDKYWIVESVSEGGLVLRTARGKSHVVPADDPNLRKPSLKEWLWLHLLARERLVQLRGQCAGSELGRSGQP